MSITSSRRWPEATLELRRSSVAQWLRVEPIETHPDLKWASINEPYTYHHANTVYTTVRHDLHTVSIGHEDQVANRPYEMFLPHQLFELCLSEKWPFRLLRRERSGYSSAMTFPMRSCIAGSCPPKASRHRISPSRRN
jgi:hypothetical protein